MKIPIFLVLLGIMSLGCLTRDYTKQNDRQEYLKTCIVFHSAVEYDLRQKCWIGYRLLLPSIRKDFTPMDWALNLLGPPSEILKSTRTIVGTKWEDNSSNQKTINIELWIYNLF